MPRSPQYAVLHALDAENLPIGIAIERRGYVYIDAIEEYGLPTRIEEEYRVRQRDLSEVTYRPGATHYFDHVLIELARLVGIGERSTVKDADWGTISSLLREKVTGPRIAALHGEYPRALSPSVIKAQAYAQPVYRVRGDRPLTIHGAGRQAPPNVAKTEVGAPGPSRGRHRVAA